MSPELLTNRLHSLQACKLTTAVDRCSTDVYANGVTLTLLLKAVLREVPYEHYLFEPRPNDGALTEHQRLEAHLANYRRFMQYPDEYYSPLRFLGSFQVPRDCQDTRLTAAQALSHSFIKRMAKRRAEAASVPPSPPPRRPDWWMLGRKQSMRFACFVELDSDTESDDDSVAVIHADCSAKSSHTTTVLSGNVTPTWQMPECEERVGIWRAAWIPCTALLGSAAALAGYVRM
ncbi:hypothetical protein COCOBI_09-6010 [Coccomyxa sp. Obi]|nr:hypothetical protein COCOBI_09-6010 [Coccomyxa sp. Obi]